MNTRTHSSASSCLNSLHIITHLILAMGFPGGSVVENPPAFESGRSPRGGNDNPLQYSCLENFMDRGA